MTDWLAANLKLRADRDTMNDTKRCDREARKRVQAAETRRLALAALAWNGRD